MKCTAQSDLYLSFASMTASLPLGCTPTFTLHVSMRQSKSLYPRKADLSLPLLLARRYILWIHDESSAYSIMTSAPHQPAIVPFRKKMDRNLLFRLHHVHVRYRSPPHPVLARKMEKAAPPAECLPAAPLALASQQTVTPLEAVVSMNPNDYVWGMNGVGMMPMASAPWGCPAWGCMPCPSESFSCMQWHMRLNSSKLACLLALRMQSGGHLGTGPGCLSGAAQLCAVPHAALEADLVASCSRLFVRGQSNPLHCAASAGLQGKGGCL